MVLQVAQSPVRVLAAQELLEPVHLGLEIPRLDRLEVVVPVRLGPRNLQIVSEGVELDVVGNPDSLTGVTKVLALDGVHFELKLRRLGGLVTLTRHGFSRIFPASRKIFLKILGESQAPSGQTRHS